ncbi:MAG: hypothetical protein E7167_05045 [Firmicutes bacterium]|nr:hypothetical protein [Bacillota bacterium]
MKKLIILFICITLILYTTIKADKISDYIANIISDNQKLIIKEKNEYAKNEGFKYVDLSNDYIPYSYNDLMNIIYSVINNGWDTFTFYCPSEYKSCLTDIEKISNDNLTLTHINNFVHPFNSFIDLNTAIYESGQITLNIVHLYSDSQIEAVNTEIDRIMNLIVKKDASIYDNIKAIHDYIINTTKYDESEEADEEGIHPSDLAYGTLFNHLARCNGYTDTMAIFLTKLGVKNYKITTTQEDISYDSTGHVWNAVYLDGKWLHLDLTWDDPVSSSGADYLHHKYFLVSTEEMNEADFGDVTIEEHNFRKNIYIEFN